MKNDCAGVQSELSAYIDNELPPTERAAVDKHLGDCPRCRRELDELKTLAAGVAALPRLQPVPPFLAEVRRKIADDGKSQGKAWHDYLFRPLWLKVPLETMAILAIIALMIGIERPAGERPVKSEAGKGVGQETKVARAATEAQPMKEPLSKMAVGGMTDEKPQPPTPSAAVAPVPLTSMAGLQQEAPAAVVVVHANDFNGVRNRAQQLASAVNGRVVPPPNPTAGTQSIFVELPQEKVASFKARLLQVTEPDLATGETGAASKIAPRSVVAMGIGPGVLTGGAGSNLMAVGAARRGGVAAGQKAPTVVLEIQVVPPPH